MQWNSEVQSISTFSLIAQKFSRKPIINHVTNNGGEYQSHDNFYQQMESIFLLPLSLPLRTAPNIMVFPKGNMIMLFKQDWLY